MGIGSRIGHHRPYTRDPYPTPYPPISAGDSIRDNDHMIIIIHDLLLNTAFERMVPPPLAPLALRICFGPGYIVVAPPGPVAAYIVLVVELVAGQTAAAYTVAAVAALLVRAPPPQPARLGLVHDGHVHK